MKNSKTLTKEEIKELLELLQLRFEKNMNRHKDMKWTRVLSKLESNPEKLWSLWEMERTGGEPDIIEDETIADGYVFMDCSAETPKERRSICYDREALDKRKLNKPENSAMEMASEMGVELLTEAQYRKLQTFGKFDLKTSSWIKTPAEIRKLGGALFCDRRYDHIFVYHNGADSYYAARGFRAMLKI